MAIYSKQDNGFFQKAKQEKFIKMNMVHFHSTHELYYLVKGQTKYFIGNKIFLLKPGDMIFVPKGEFHKTDYTGYEEDEKIERILFDFDDDFVGKEYQPLIDEMTKNKHITFPKEHLYKITDIISKSERESKKKEKGYADMQKLYLRQLLILISRYRNQETKSSLNESYTLMQEVAKYIFHNYNADLSLACLSQKYSISPNHLSKQFKKVTGVGLNEYINISRISAAEKLLAKTNLPITQVATACGFNDSNYFAAVFKRINGITPKKYAILSRS